MNPWIAFVIGLFIGSWFGIGIMCLMQISASADKHIDEEEVNGEQV